MLIKQASHGLSLLKAMAIPLLCGIAATTFAADKKPNIVVIWS